MIHNKLVSWAMAAAIAGFITAPVIAQSAAEAEDARLRGAARQASLDPLWTLLAEDNFGQSAWNALAYPSLADALAVDPQYNFYSTEAATRSTSGSDAPSVQSFIDKLTSSTSTRTAAGTSVPARIAPTGEAVTMVARDLGNGVTENRYYMMLMTQTFDGVFERAHSQKAGFARVRNASESWVKVDFGDGALVIRSPERLGMPATLSASRFTSTTPTEVALAYDYRTNSLRGNPTTAAYHNTYIRPLMTGMPPLGANVAWKVALSAEKLGVVRAGSGEFPMEVKRTYISHAGTPYVILEYTVPEFTYGNSVGERVTHRARGVALADPGMGQIFWNTSLQTATAAEATGGKRPYRYARTGFAADASGDALVDLEQIPELKRYLDEFYSAEAKAPLPTRGWSVPDQIPLEMATRIDLAGFTLAENSANQLGEVIGATVDAAGRAAGYGNGDAARNTGTNVYDNLLNFFVGPAGSMAGAAATQIVNAGEVSVARNEASIVRAAMTEINAVIDRTAEIRTQLAAHTDEIARATDTLADVRGQILVYEEQFRVALRSGKPLAETLRQVADLPAKFAEAARREQNLLGIVSNNLVQRTQLLGEMNQILKVEEAARQYLANPAVLQVAGMARQVQSFLTANKWLSPTLSRIGYASSSAGIAKNMYLLANFNPYAGGDIALNGSYSGWKGVAEPVAALLGTLGDTLSGDRKAVILGAVNFTGGRLGDIFMAWRGDYASQVQRDQALTALTETQIARMRQQYAQSRQHDQQLLDSIDRLSAELRTERAAAQTPGGVTDPNWRDPRFETNGRPIRSYWAWLKENDPDALRRMGIDPDAPVGGWPNGVRPEDRPATQAAQETEQPRQPGGLDYPTRDPRTVERRTSDPEPETVADTEMSPEDVMHEMAEASARPARYVPPPRPPARNDHIDTDEQPDPLRFEPVTMDPVTFEPPTFTGPTWEPPEWEPPVWEPPTWEPPEWTPPKFDPPKASEIEWTDLEVGKKWPRSTDNMAFTYGDMSGTVATDLSEYEEWLKTQNITFLEQLAKTAGYPNLASALADWPSLIRKANDPKFYEWAWSPPAVSGAIGIGFSEGQHEMGRAAYMLGDLLKRSGLFDGKDDTRVASGDTDFDDSKETLRSRNGFGAKGSAAEIARNAYGGNYQVQRDASGRLGRESGGRLAASLYERQDPYLRQLMANGRSGLDRLLAQPFNVILTWGENAYDLDLHMTGPLGEGVTDRFHIYYSETGALDAQPHAALIKDCICESGSEVILTSALNRGGVYRVSVFNYGDQSSTSANLSTESQARIQIVRGGTTQSIGNGTTIIGGTTILTATIPGGGQLGNTWTAVELDPRNGRITVPDGISQSSGSGGVH